MIRMTWIVAGCAAIGLAASSPAWSDSKKGGEEQEHKREAVELSKTAKVTVEQAIKTAAGKVAGKIIEVELERKHDKGVWEVEVVGADGKVTEVHIDAETGAVIDTEEKNAEKKAEGKVKGKGKKD